MAANHLWEADKEREAASASLTTSTDRPSLNAVLGI
jgi:hypothetical protein